MGWVRVSDDFYDHPKFDEVGPLGIAMWISGLAWCNRNLSDGVIPRSAVVRLLDWEGVGSVLDKADSNGDRNGVSNGARNSAVAAVVAQMLVDGGLWEVTEGGYSVCGYLKYQRSAAQIKADANSNAARQKRWRDSHPDQKRNGDRNGVSNARVTGAPNPNPKGKKTSSSTTSAEPPRADVDQLCTRLADRVEGNGANRPTIGKTWLDAARLMLDTDKRDFQQALRLIDWCQSDAFWKANVLSMPTFREKYDQLLLKAKASTQNGQQRTSTERPSVGRFHQQ